MGLESIAETPTEITEDEKTFLTVVAAHRGRVSSWIYAKAEFSLSKGERIKKALEKKGFIAVEKSPRGVKKHFLSLTAEGQRFSGEWTEPSSLLRVEPEQMKEGNPNCTHYWKIEPANGPTSRGECCFCGKTRLFTNIIDDPNSTFA